MTTPATIRPARPDDVPIIFALIKELAAYEKLSHEVQGSVEALGEHLFGEQPCIEALIATANGDAVGFALYFWNYSTFLTRPGVHLEDIYVRPAHRGRGIGKALLQGVGRVATSRGAGRLEWAVLDWNESAIGFYERLQAQVLTDWRICRLTGEGLEQL